MNTALELSQCSFKYPKSKTPVFKNVSLNIPEGQTWGILGPNGSGKTTLIRLMLGLIRPSRGECKLLNARPNRLLLHKVGVLVENPGGYKKLSATEYLNFFSKIYGLNNIGPRIEELAEKLNFELNSKPMGKMSMGQKQKIQLMRCLIHKPKLLILDEPFSHLDPEAQSLLSKLISEYLKERGATLLLATHQLNLAENLCSYVCLLGEGRIHFKGSVSKLREESGVEETLKLVIRGEASRALLKLMEAMGIQCLKNHRENLNSKEDHELELSGEGLREKTPAVLRELIHKGFEIRSAVPGSPDLYELYRSQTQKGARL